jgi:hypothetical protein
MCVCVCVCPTAQDKKKNFADIFDDKTIGPLELKLRNIMDAKLNTDDLVAERGKGGDGQLHPGHLPYPARLPPASDVNP